MKKRTEELQTASSIANSILAKGIIWELNPMFFAACHHPNASFPLSHGDSDDRHGQIEPRTAHRHTRRRWHGSKARGNHSPLARSGKYVIPDHSIRHTDHRDRRTPHCAAPAVNPWQGSALNGLGGQVTNSPPAGLAGMDRAGYGLQSPLWLEKQFDSQIKRLVGQ